MATTYTPNYNLAQPEVGGELDTWGGLLNADFGILDTALKAVSDVANAALPKAGGTIAGQLVVTSGGTAFTVNKAASGSDNRIDGDTNLVRRWSLILGDSTAEAANGGSNFVLARYNDGGSVVGIPLAISRLTGAATLEVRPSWAGLTPYDTGNFNPGNYAALAGATFTGDVNISGSVALKVNTGNFYVGAGGAGAFNGNGAYVAWNRIGAGETDIINHRGGGPGGFLFYNTDGTTYTVLSNLTSGGVWTATDFQSTSDARLKTDVQPLTNATERLKLARPRTYRKEGRPEAGFIAQEVQAVLATAVADRGDGMLTVSLGQLTALVAAVVLEVEARVSALELV